MEIETDVLDWLLLGDPLIRWQVMRDLMGEPQAVWQAEQARVPLEGWGAAFLSRQLPDGAFPKARWTDTIWTLMLQLDCGFPKQNEALRKAARHDFSAVFSAEQPIEHRFLRERLDLCHVGFRLRSGAAFLLEEPRLGSLSDVIFELQLEDGGWNCRKRNYPETTHSSFNTTFNVLEGLREAVEAGILDRAVFEPVEARALEFMLEHRLFKSDKTGKVVDERMTYLTFPSYWHYTVLRGLDYIRTTPFIGDPRLEDAIALLESKRRPNGRWPVEGRIPGITFFDMEKPGTESRWNTLRALRVLKARDAVLPSRTS